MGRPDNESKQINLRPTKCELCGGHMEYISHGKYRCEDCGNIVMDDFGKIRQYIEEHGPASAYTISEATGVSISIINGFLREGRIEIPEGSDIYIKCEKCGTDIRYGRYCPSCATGMFKQIQGALDVGEVPKSRTDRKGEMRFLDIRRKR